MSGCNGSGSSGISAMKRTHDQQSIMNTKESYTTGRIISEFGRCGGGGSSISSSVPVPGSNEPFIFVTGSPKGYEGVMYNPARRDSLKNVF